MEWIELLIKAYVMLFVVIDPIGASSVFAGLTMPQTKLERQKLAIRCSVIALCIQLFFAFLGEWILSEMSISGAAFRMAGGVLLFITAMRLVTGQSTVREIRDDKTTVKKHEDIAVYPMAIPLLSGPGTLSSIVLLMTTADTQVELQLTVLLAIGLMFITTLLCLLFTVEITRALGKTGIEILTRLFGVLLAALATQFVADGIVQFYHNMQLVPVS